MNQLLRIKFTTAVIVRRAIPMVLLLGAILACAGCSADDGLGKVGDSDRLINFGIDKAPTRALPVTDVKNIGVFGYSHTGSFDATNPTLVPDYFLNRSVIKPNGSTTWSYTGVVKYWPEESVNLSFFAYAPYIDVEDTFVLTPQSASQIGVPKIDYTVPADVTKQIDLMWSNAFDQVYSTNNGKVDFTMKHALTKINFLVKLATAEANRPFQVTVKEMTVKNLVGGGVLNLEKDAADDDLWTLTYPATDAGLVNYKLAPGTGLKNFTLDATVASSTTNFQTLLDGGHFFMLIPQIIKDQNNSLTPPMVEIKYTYTNTLSGEIINDVVTLNLATATLQEWKAGESINYQINISLLEGTEIEFDIESLISNTPWGDGNNGTDINGEVN